MINELPTLEKLKIRHPDLYKKDLDCIRYNKKKEILSHIWECSEVNNLIVMFELELKKWLNDNVKKLNNIYYHDSLLDKLYKYTRFKVTLKDSNTENSTEYYRSNGYVNKCLTYIWDENGCLDNIITGWIPNDLILTIKSFQKSSRNKEIEELLMQWSNKVIDFIKQLWIQRNKDMIEWEKAHDISKAEKRKSVQIKKLN